MDDPRTAEGLEHLQAAAGELVAAARSFLDVAEEVISDPQRFAGAAEGLIEVLRVGLGRTEPLWENYARDRGDPVDVTDVGPDDEARSAEGSADDDVAGKRSKGRVRRISVD